MKRKNQESQRGIFITNIVPKAYEIVYIHKEDPERGNTKQHVQYVDCRKEKQINNG